MCKEIDKSINDYINKESWEVRENSNQSYSLQGLNTFLSSKTIKSYWLNSVYPQNIKDAVQSSQLHIHDLGYLSAYCVGWDLQDLLTVGFQGAYGKPESSPATHLRSALGQLVNFFYTLQGEAAGAQAVSNFDTLLAPFIWYDGLNYTEVKQCMQEFVFNANVPTRSGFQSPFTNVTMDLEVPSTLANEQVIIGGARMGRQFSEFQTEMNTFNRAFAEVMTEGDAKGRIFTFPIPTYNITKDFDWSNPELDAIWKMTGKYGTPYFSNFINSDMDPEDARSMCCRLRLDNRELRKRGGLFGANPLTGSLGVVTINLPQIAHLATDEIAFLHSLEQLIRLGAESLGIKRELIEKLTDQGLYPYSKFYLRAVKERTGKFWKNHFSTIGIVGMNEACTNFLGAQYNIGSSEGQAFAARAMDFCRGVLVQLQEETGEIFNLEATPAESTAYRLALADKETFPGILCANESTHQEGAAPYYTNSSQLPVNYTDDMFQALELQDSLQTKYNGGTVHHVFVGEEIPDTEVVKKLVRKIASTFSLPYFTITPVFSVCPTHGYITGEVPVCPKCSSVTEMYSRIVGYLRPVSQWNAGKQAEYSDRTLFKVG